MATGSMRSGLSRLQASMAGCSIGRSGKTSQIAALATLAPPAKLPLGTRIVERSRHSSLRPFDFQSLRHSRLIDPEVRYGLGQVRVRIANHARDQPRHVFQQAEDAAIFGKSPD